MVKGIHATVALLKGAKQLPSAGKFEEVYVKVGSYGHAKLDFFSVLNLRNIDVTAVRSFIHIITWPCYVAWCLLQHHKIAC